MEYKEIIKNKPDKDLPEIRSFLTKPIGSIIGFGSAVTLGFSIYYLLQSIQSQGEWLSYNNVFRYAESNWFYKFVWLIMNFSEPQFYAGVCASIGVVFGGWIAWRLEQKKSNVAGFPICNGTQLWPWVFASQMISITIAIFVLDYTRFEGGLNWLPTFISIVGVPPAVILLYGPNLRALFTGSALGGILSFPIAFWTITKVIDVLELPHVVGSVFTMAITGVIVLEICTVLPWMKNLSSSFDLNETEITVADRLNVVSKPSWFIRRVLADFSEAQFYGNEIAGMLVIAGVAVDWVLNTGHPAYGTGAIPTILLSQFVGSSTGIFLYFDQYLKNGWYPTFIPVVSVGPACVLGLGATIPVALTAGVLGGIMGGPLAMYFVRKLPKHLHPTIGNVTSMGVCTTIIFVVMKAMPWF